MRIVVQLHTYMATFKQVINKFKYGMRIYRIVAINKPKFLRSQYLIRRESNGRRQNHF